MEQPTPIKQLDRKYICCICNKVFINVNQAQCGCRFCSDCLDKILPSGKCYQCSEIWHDKFKYMDKAFQKELSCMSVSCDKCDWSGFLSNYQLHYNENHGEKLKCNFHSIGCNCELLGKTELEAHLKLDVTRHLQYLFLHFKRIELDNGENKVFVKDSNVSNNGNIGLEDKKCLENSDKQMSLATLQREHNDEMMSMCLNQEKLSQQLEITRNNEKQLRDELEELKKRLTVSQVAIIDLEQRLLQQEKTSYNGTLVWKIVNVKEKIMEAKSGKQTSFYSPIFYSHHNGYKMRCRIYLNGDGMGRGTHVSLFFVLMKGEHDGLLNWPFHQKVTFTLLDQVANESREHITDAFKPDPKSSSFMRPVTEMNIASGIPLFCSLPKLHSTDHEYIKDDTMFIKTIVDTRGDI